MSGVRFTYGGAPIAVVASTTKTLFQILAAANHRVKIEKIRISGDSVDATDPPVEWHLILQTTAGSGGTASTLTKLDEDATETVQASGLHGITTEPTGSIVLWSGYISPLGSHEIVFPPGRELYVAGGSRVGVTAITPADANNFIVSVDMAE